MDPAGSISEERRLPKLHSSMTFTSDYLQETALSSDILVIVALMFVDSCYRRALFRTNTHKQKIIVRVLVV